MTQLTQLGFNWVVLMYFLAGVVGGLARVIRYYGWSGFKSWKLAFDAIFTASGGVIYPTLAPQIWTDKVSPLVTALCVAALTYWTNHIFITLIKRALNYVNQPEDEPPGQTGQGGKS